jgi:serpin B
MVRETFLVAALSLGACAHDGGGGARPAPAAELGATAATTPAGSIDSFGANLEGVLRTRPGNFVFSPASIAMALSMAREGARGQTAAAMDRVITPGAQADAKALLAKVSAQPRPGLQGAPMPSEIHVANRIFADGATVFLPAFLDVTKNDWHAPAETVDFRGAPEAGRARINRWVAGETRDKIQNLLAPGTIRDDTRMVLVNAVYMKAQWQSPFRPEATKPAPFWTSASASKQVPMMNGTVRGSMGEHAGATVLSMPYAASAGSPQLSMLVIVPKEKDGLRDVENAYVREGTGGFAKALTDSGEIVVRMPRFKVTGAFELEKTLSTLGMGLAFTDDADFSGMSAKTPLEISRVIHQAYADVDEKGTEAAAATAVVMTEITSVSRRKPLAVTVDRPFLFFVRDDAGAVLFAGRVSDPS